MDYLYPHRVLRSLRYPEVALYRPGLLLREVEKSLTLRDPDLDSSFRGVLEELLYQRLYQRHRTLQVQQIRILEKLGYPLPYCMTLVLRVKAVLGRTPLVVVTHVLAGKSLRLAPLSRALAHSRALTHEFPPMGVCT